MNTRSTNRRFGVRNRVLYTGLVFIITMLVTTVLAGQLPARAETPSGGGQPPEESKLELPLAFGMPGSLTALPSYGLVSDKLYLEVPPGRRGVEPRLAISYNSMAGLGILGPGWSLDATGSVEIWRGDGIPNVGIAGSYAYSLAGAGGQLIDTGGGAYRAKSESVYRVFRLNPQHGGWEMYNGEGGLHRFGGTPESRIDGVQWMLDLVQDAHGNTMTYTYERKDGVLYLKEIHYTGYAPANEPGANRVVFTYAAGSDTRVDYSLTVLQEKKRLLESICMYAGDQLARCYDLTYQTSTLNNLSYLTAITLVGSDGESSATLRTLEYTTRGAGWNAASSVAWPAGVDPLTNSDGRDTGVRLVDVNGDAFADLVTNTGTVYLGSSGGNFSAQADPTWSASLQAANIQFVYPSTDKQGMDKGVRLLDVNGDALPDLLIAQKGRKAVYLNTGHGWSETAQVDSGGVVTTGQQWANNTTGLRSLESHLSYSGDPQEFWLAGKDGDPFGSYLVDVNADGRVDIVWSWEWTDSFWNVVCDWIDSTCYSVTSVRGVFLNTGTGWAFNQTLTNSLGLMDFFVSDAKIQGYDLLDVNGDGLSDVIRNKSDKTVEARLSSGSGWARDTNYTASLSANNLLSISGDKPQGLIPLDYNSDGLVDYIQANQTTKRALVNTGSGWAADPSITTILTNLGVSFSDSEGKGTGTFPVELNGDGALDIIQYKSGTPNAFFGKGPRHGLLSRSTTALGEVTTITWGLSTETNADYNNKRADGTEGLPAALPVVKQIQRQDGSGETYTYAFFYKGGLFTGRQFRGFRETLQVLPNGLKVLSQYEQSEGLAGMAVTEQSIDRSGQVRLERNVHYEKVNAGGGVTQIYLNWSDDKGFDPGGQRHTRTTYQMNDHLVCTSVTQDPDPDVAGDEVTMNYSWALNEERGIWGLLSKAQVLNSAETVLREAITYYDGLLVNKAEKGLPTSAMEMVQPGSYITRSFEYDSYGNIVKTIDREGSAATFEYDDTHSFRIRAIDAEGRVFTSAYDPRFGELTEETDAAGRSMRKEYDVFGRLVKITEPGDQASPNGSRTITYSGIGDPTAQYYQVSDTEVSGEAGTLDQTYSYDGMGRIYRAEREADGGRKVVVLTTYDYAGNAEKTSSPFFDGDTPVWTEVVRDELNLPVTVTQPDGSQVSTSQSGWQVEITDALGVKTSYLRNTRRQVTEIHQSNDGVEQVTRYQYDLLGDLTRITDALGEETHISYDMLGRKLRLEDPNTGVYAYQYDNEGRVTRAEGPGGKIITYRYDRTGLILEKQFVDGSRQQFAYNPAGALVQVDDAAGTVYVGYDESGRPASHTRVALGTAYETRYAYDALDRVTGITYPDGYEIHYAYGAGGNLLEVTDGSGQALASGMAYNAAGQLLNIEYGNGVQSSLGYDVMQHMTSIQTSAGGQEPLQNLEYTYNPNGNILSIIDGSFGYSQNFTYDDLGRLVEATGKYGVETYAYDAIGNLLRKGNLVYGYDPQHPQRLNCGVDASQAQGSANGIANSPHAGLCAILTSPPAPAITNPKDPKTSEIRNPNLARSFAITYDEAGNAVEKGGRRYEYDTENHLLRVRDAKGKLLAENVYDVAGQRVLQITPNDKTIYIDGIYEVGKTHITRHVFAGPLLVASVVKPLALADTGEGLTPSHINALAGAAGMMGLFAFASLWTSGRRKHWLARLRAFGDAFRAHPIRMILFLVVLNSLVSIAAAPEFNGQASLWLKGAEKTFYYHSNHLGSVNVITNEQGKVVERREYKPYGEAFEWSGPNSGPREFLTTFQGQTFDDPTGLYYMGARHYDPEIGRFLAGDTQVPDPYNPQTLNRYAFVGGNPIRYSDPSGHGACEWIVAAIIILALVVLTALVVFTAGVALFGLTGLGAAVLAGGIVLGAAAIGAGIGAGVAWGLGYSPGDEQFWDILALGALSGAAIGAGICTGIILAGEYTAGVTVAGAGWNAGAGVVFAKLAGGAVFCACTGVWGYNLASLGMGVRIENILSTTMFTSIGISAGIGFAFGFASLTLASWAAGLSTAAMNSSITFWGWVGRGLASGASWTLNFINMYLVAPGFGKAMFFTMPYICYMSHGAGEYRSVGYDVLTGYWFSGGDGWRVVTWPI